MPFNNKHISRSHEKIIGIVWKILEYGILDTLFMEAYGGFPIKM